MLSEYQLKIADLYNISIGNVKKLVPNLFDKEKYMIHYENLKLYLRLGLKLKNTSRIRTQDVYEGFSSNKKMFDFSNYSTKSKYHDDSNKVVIAKMKDETGGVAIEEFVGLKPKMFSFLVDKNEHKKAKGLNKNVVATISHNEYEDVLLKNKCLRHSMNRIQSKDHRI